MAMVSDDIAPEQRNGKPVREFVATFPVSEESKAQLIGVYEGGARDPLSGQSADEKLELLKTISYRDYLTRILGCSEEAANCFQGRPRDFFAFGADAVAASDARDNGYPGFRGLGLADVANPELDEPYIYHFPDGNASLARLLARSLIPEAASGSTMDDIVLTAFDYGKLDLPGPRYGSGWRALVSTSETPRWASRSPTCAMASCTVSVRIMPSSPATT